MYNLYWKIMLHLFFISLTYDKWHFYMKITSIRLYNYYKRKSYVYEKDNGESLFFIFLKIIFLQSIQTITIWVLQINCLQIAHRVVVFVFLLRGQILHHPAFLSTGLCSAGSGIRNWFPMAILIPHRIHVFCSLFCIQGFCKRKKEWWCCHWGLICSVDIIFVDYLWVQCVTVKNSVKHIVFLLDEYSLHIWSNTSTPPLIQL